MIRLSKSKRSFAAFYVKLQLQNRKGEIFQSLNYGLKFFSIDCAVHNSSL